MSFEPAHSSAETPAPVAWSEEPGLPDLPSEEPGLPDLPPWEEPPPPAAELPESAGVDDALAELAEDVPLAEASASEPTLEELEPPDAYTDPAVSVPDGVSPEDLVADSPDTPVGWPDSASVDMEVEGLEGGSVSGGFLEAPGPSWDDVADTCLALGSARGAMLVESSGQVLAARGDWPNPGPETIAGRLVAMMEKALRDAPTRSVSAPIAGQHLTAWRVPIGEGLLTAVFMADAPLRAEVRPSIDEEIRRAAGS